MFLNQADVASALEQATDETLMVAVAGQNREAFAELVKRHLSRVESQASKMLGSRADGEEVAQDAFIRVWSRSANWADTAAQRSVTFRGWLHRIVVNLVVDRQRKRVMVPIDTVQEPVDDFSNGFAHLYSRQLSHLISTAIARLPSRQKTALILCCVEGHSNIEASTIMSSTVGAVESLLIRGRRALRDELDYVYRDNRCFGW